MVYMVGNHDLTYVRGSRFLSGLLLEDSILLGQVTRSCISWSSWPVWRIRSACFGRLTILIEELTCSEASVEMGARAQKEVGFGDKCVMIRHLSKAI